MSMRQSSKTCIAMDIVCQLASETSLLLSER